MVNPDIGRILLEVLASLVIQCTPLDVYPGGVWTWSDGNACWYTIGVERLGESGMTLDFVKYEGEVRTDARLTLGVRRGADGTWAVDRFKRGEDGQWQTVSGPLQAFPGGVVPQAVYIAPWESRQTVMRLVHKEVSPDGQAVVYSYQHGTVDVSVAVIKGQLARISMSPDGKRMADAEHLLTREGGNQ